MPQSFYVGIKAIITIKNKVLLLEAIDQDGRRYWDIPGGRIDKEEEIADTLHRELSEELGLKGGYLVGKLLGAYKLNKVLKDGHSLMLQFYEVEAEGFAPTLSEEHESYKWFSMEDLMKLNSNSDPYIDNGYLLACKEALTN